MSVRRGPAFVLDFGSEAGWSEPVAKGGVTARSRRHMEKAGEGGEVATWKIGRLIELRIWQVTGLGIECGYFR
jgi:hypothetical protein